MDALLRTSRCMSQNAYERCQLQGKTSSVDIRSHFGSSLCELRAMLPGSKVRALLPRGGVAMRGVATVCAVRTSLRRESDFVALTMDQVSESVLQVTATHRMPEYSC